MIVTATPTIGSGVVVRWYLTDDVRHADVSLEPDVSASRDGVRLGAYLHEVPRDLLDLATAVYRELHGGDDGRAKTLATHRRRGLGGPLEPVESTTLDGVRTTDERSTT